MSSRKEEKDPHDIRNAVQELIPHAHQCANGCQRPCCPSMSPKKWWSTSNWYHLSTSDLVDLHTKGEKGSRGIHPCTWCTHKHTDTQTLMKFWGWIASWDKLLVISAIKEMFSVFICSQQSESVTASMSDIHFYRHGFLSSSREGKVVKLEEPLTTYLLSF